MLSISAATIASTFAVGCLAFQAQPPITIQSSRRSGRPITSFTCLHSTTSSADSSIFDLNIWGGDEPSEPLGKDGTVGIELWLDLRGTSLTPKTALELWELEEQQNGQVVGNPRTQSLPTAPFVTCLVDSSTRQSKNEDDIHINVDTYLVEEGGGDDNMAMIRPQQTEGESDSIGRIVTLQTSSTMPVLPDPLPAMEIVSRGEWVILDTNGWDKIGEEERIGMALPMVELISSAGGDGGVGLTCQTKSEVVKAAMFIRTMTNGGGNGGGTVGRTTTLESGIVIPDGGALDSGGKTNSNGNKKFALVVPYDPMLLQTAKMLLCGESELC